MHAFLYPCAVILEGVNQNRPNVKNQLAKHIIRFTEWCRCCHGYNVLTLFESKVLLLTKSNTKKKNHFLCTYLL